MPDNNVKNKGDALKFGEMIPADGLSSRKQEGEKKQPPSSRTNSGARNGRRDTRARGKLPSAGAAVQAVSGKENRNQAAAGKDGAVQKTSGAKQPSRRGRKPAASKQKTTLKIIPLGGLYEIGKNITVYEYGSDIFIVDCGMSFPDEGMPGIDSVIPDFTYVLNNREKIRGIVLTHGHEDHIGGLAYLLKELNVPVYGTRLTLGLVEGKLREHGLARRVKLNVVKARDVIKLGVMSVEFIAVNHSIPDACALHIMTPVGSVIMTGDFKVDYTPIQGQIIDLARFGELGSQGVLALLSDSTNAERPGSVMSERTVGESMDRLFAQAEGRRILVATFASNVHRVQQIINTAVKRKRKVAVSGRSMENLVSIAGDLGYLKIPKGVLLESIDEINKYSDDKLVIITTGSQGEPMSALTRMAMGEHRKVSVTPNDFIIISASPIPGNEKLVGRVINELMKQGAEVIYEKSFEIHVSGHACQDELKLMIGLTRPKFFLPVHGEYKHLRKHAQLGISMGIQPDHVLIGEVGRVFETDGETMKMTGSVPAGQVLVDGLGVGDVGSVVLRDRKHLSEDGLIVVVAAVDNQKGQIIAGPDIVSRGFVYVREAEDLINQARGIARESLQKCLDGNIREWGNIKQRIKDDVGNYLYQKTKRSPMILPVIQEVHKP